MEWKLSIDVKELYNQFPERFDDKLFKELLPKMVKVFRSVTSKVGEIVGDETEYTALIDNLADSDNYTGFNAYWDDLYNFADEHHIWIKTF